MKKNTLYFITKSLTTDRDLMLWILSNPERFKVTTKDVVSMVEGGVQTLYSISYTPDPADSQSGYHFKVSGLNLVDLLFVVRSKYEYMLETVRLLEQINVRLKNLNDENFNPNA